MARGDHIRARRQGYWHHGIDCGDGTVIHYSGELLHHKDASVRRSSMEQFARTGTLEVVEHATGYDAETVIQRAESRLGETGYHVIANNCEHFAEWCATGQSESSQIRRAARFAGTLCIAAGAIAITAIGTGLALRARRAKDIQESR